MCRSILRLHRTPDEPATPEEVHAAALQFVRKISGYRVPSKQSAEVFERAVDDVEAVIARMLNELPPRRSVARKAE
jgi:hypothetical protein